MSVWRVVDANFLRSPLLENYLRTGDNYVVFTEHGCMESYKGAGLQNISSSLDIVTRYPSQVMILHGARHIVSLQSRSGYEARRDEFVDWDQTRDFREFCAAVRHALSGGAPRLSEELLVKSRLANDRFARALRDAELTGQAIRALAASYDPVLRKQLRTRAPLSTESGQVIVTGILQVAALLFKSHPDVTHIPGPNELPGSLIFRHALGVYLLALRWISDGGIDSAPTQKLANDVVDVTHVAYATFFDGLLSMDKKVNDLYEEAVWLLGNVFHTAP